MTEFVDDLDTQNSRRDANTFPTRPGDVDDGNNKDELEGNKYRHLPDRDNLAAVWQLFHDGVRDLT